MVTLQAARSMHPHLTSHLLFISIFDSFEVQFSSVQFSHSVVSDSLRSHRLQHTRPPCTHQFQEFTQTHVRWVGDAIQPAHPLSSPSPPAFNLSQHQGLFKWVSSSHQVAKVFELQLQHQSFQWIIRTDFLSDGLVGSPCSPRDSQSLLQHHSSLNVYRTVKL